MSLERRVARAEIPDREWVELEVQTDEKGIVQEAVFKAWGCHKLIEASQIAVKKLHKKSLNEIIWEGASHWDLLVAEAIIKLQGQFQLPITEEELCHCRKIPTAKVDHAIVLGAQTPEKVRAWTSASSGCGTCRPNVEKLISYRLRKTS